VLTMPFQHDVDPAQTGVILQSGGIYPAHVHLCGC
jgi:hypothetical protein